MKSLGQSFGDKLRNLRESHQPKKMTQQNLADKLGLDSQTVSNWERGIQVPQWDNIETLSRIFDKPVGYFLDQGINQINPIVLGPTAETIYQYVRELEGRAASDAQEFKLLLAFRKLSILKKLDLLARATRDPADIAAYKNFARAAVAKVQEMREQEQSSAQENQVPRVSGRKRRR